jgi:hypothetical protein
VSAQIFANCLNINPDISGLRLTAHPGRTQVCPENNFSGGFYPTLKEAGCPQVFGKILTSFSIVAIYKIKPPLPVILEVHPVRNFAFMCYMAAQKQLAAIRYIVANQHTIAETSRI